MAFIQRTFFLQFQMGNIAIDILMLQLVLQLACVTIFNLLCKGKNTIEMFLDYYYNVGIKLVVKLDCRLR